MRERYCDPDRWFLGFAALHPGYLLEVDEDKREALFSRLSEFQEEVDRNRTRFDAFAALAIGAGGVVGEVVEKSRTLKLLDGIARVFWVSKKEEETKRLSSLTPPKRLEPPPAPARPAVGRRAKGGLDDDVPL